LILSTITVSFGQTLLIIPVKAMSTGYQFTDGTGYGHYMGGNNLSSGGHLDGGGGFDNRGNNDSQFGSGSQGGKPNYAKQFISPVTIKMLNEATLEGGHDGTYFTHGVELSYVRFIGVVRDIDDQNSTHKMLKLEDGTEMMKLRVWKSDSTGDDEDAYGDSDGGFKEPEYGTGDYVEVVATVKEFNNQIQFQTQRIAKIKNFNQVPYHFLNVAKNFLVHKNGGSLAAKSDQTKAEGLFVADNDDASGSATTAANNASKPLPDRLLDFIKQHSQTMSDGVPMQFMSHEMSLTLKQVEEAISELVEDGRIFSTTDETQFLPL
jgi:replication factor A2